MLVGSSSFLQQFVSETLQEPKLETSYGSFHSWSKRNNWSSQCVPVIKHSRGLACLTCIAETIDHESPTKFSDTSKWKIIPTIAKWWCLKDEDLLVGETRLTLVAYWLVLLQHHTVVLDLAQPILYAHKWTINLTSNSLIMLQL
jgi:hypothetical protein